MTPPVSFTLPKMPESKREEMTAAYQDIKPDLEKVEEQLEAWSRSENPLTAEVSRYVLRKRGKRLRPALVLLTSRLFGAGRSGEEVFLASLVELIHTASLIHDDIVDKADLRRGAPSVHAKWGANITVLLGDYLYIKSIGLSLQSRHDSIIRLLAGVSARMIEGELDEYALRGDLGITEEQYLAVAEKKTAALFSACCRIGAVLGRAADAEEEGVAAFGLNLGLAFQIVDDLLDFTGDEKALGKPVLSDLAEGRVTLPLIHLLRNDGPPRRDRVAGLVGRRDVSGDEKAGLLKLLASSGALAHAAGKAGEFSARGLEILDRFPASPSRTALAGLARFAAERSR
ncbi:MAG: polyprenyl synthetase family protein [Acidobacteriota bacterium]